MAPDKGLLLVVNVSFVTKIYGHPCVQIPGLFLTATAKY